MRDNSSLMEMAKEYNLELTEEMLSKFKSYSDLLIEWNEKMNLTAITDKKEIEIKHFMDSLLFLSAVKPNKGASIIDVGTGAGFPGIPIKIVRNDLKLTLLDSLNKRLNFLKEVLKNINLVAELLHLRAEEGGQNPKYREKFDYVTSRAVASLPALCEYCLPYVKKGGCFVALKGPMVAEELENASSAIALLGGKLKEVKEYKLCEDNDRSIVIIEKVTNTPNKYPRRGVKISKKPL